MPAGGVRGWGGRILAQKGQLVQSYRAGNELGISWDPIPSAPFYRILKTALNKQTNKHKDDLKRERERLI